MPEPDGSGATFFQRLFEATPHPYLILGAEPGFPILAVNQRYLEATGTRREAILGRSLFEVFPDDPGDGASSSVSGLRTSLLRVLGDRRADTMGVQKYDIPLPAGGFEVRYWSPVNTPVCDPAGRVTQIIHHVEDVTEFILQKERLTQGAGPDRGRERMEAEVLRRAAEVKEANRALKTALEELEASRTGLAAANARLSELDRLKSDLFANISHELRTPLTLILGPLTQRLQDPGLDPELRPDLQRMDRNARILLARVNDLLDLARLDAGRMGLRLAPVDLARLTRLEGARFESLAAHAGLAFAVEAPGPLPVQADAEKVQRILANLLANAFKFTPAGGRIQLRLEPGAGQVALTVADSGPGVPEAMRALVFDRFRQVDAGPGRHQGGTGLGLAIVKEFAELHGGQVTLGASALGGALFTVLLPLQSAAGAALDPEPAPAEVPELQHWQPGPEGAALPGPDPAAPRVLVVEDNGDMRAFLAKALARLYRVDTAADGAEGLAKALAEPPDLLLSDVMMPGMTGDQLVEALRARPETEGLPIILLTAKADEALRVKMLRLGVGDYLFKPFSFDELLARVAALLEGRRKERMASQLQENRFQAMFDQAAVGITQMTLDGHILSANPRLCAILGYPLGELLGRPSTDLDAQPDPAGTRARVDRLCAGEYSTFTEEKIKLCKDGTPVWVSTSVSLVRDSQGRPDYLIAVVEDIQARKDAEGALAQAQAKEREMERELNHLQRLESIGRLAGGVAHDMNNVLAAILAVANYLQVGFRDVPAVVESAELMVNAAGRGKKLVQGLMDFARKEVLGSAPVDLNQLVRQEAELLDHTTLKKVAIQLDLQEGLAPVQGEAAALANALMNLCVNACDAMAAGGTLRLATRALATGHVELVVQDDGEGMPPEVAERALEPFFTTKPPGKGTGLGLAIVYGTLKAHGGTVAIRSAPGQGTRVELVFPPPGPAAQGPAGPPAPVPPLRPLKLLLVDDDELVRQTLPRLLAFQGHAVEVAASGAEALARLQEGSQVDLVLLDLNMPDLSGLATLERLRRLRPELPVLVASGYLDPAAVAALARHSRVGTLEKPFLLEEIREALAGFFPT